MVSKFYKYETKLKFYEGWVTGVEITTKEDGNSYVSFSIPLKLDKDDQPDWLNCKVYGTNLAMQFFDSCPKGTKVGIWGIFKTGQTQEGKEYVNFIVKDFVNYEKRQPKKEEGA